MLKSLTAALAAFMFAAAPSAHAAGPNAFEFVAIGDMPYNIPGDYAKFDRLIGEINKARPAFTIHVGDIKSGSTPCSDEIFRKVFDQFATFEGALVYTPGDNEWTDCHRQSNGSFNPRERLAKIREMFYPDASRSLGKAPIAVESQAGLMGDRFKTYVENTRFVRNGVLFLMVHVVGSNNGFEPRDKATADEFFDRDAANLAWIRAGFEHARAIDAKAMVISMQANVYDVTQPQPGMPSASGFVRTVRAFDDGAKVFAKPVLYIHGDEHKFVIDRMVGTNGKTIPHTTRLQVMGARDVHGVRVTVDPDTPGVFGFTPLIVRENGDY
ncbi:MAG: hypothetical protein ACRCTI_04715 [Beijerinckiaceae bacterium]